MRNKIKFGLRAAFSFKIMYVSRKEPQNKKTNRILRLTITLIMLLTFTIDKVASILSVDVKDLKNINIDVKINKVSDEVLAKYNEIAKQFKNEFVVPPVDFEIVA